MSSKLLKILKSSRAINKGHFVGVSGKHLDTYINKDAIYPDTKLASGVGKLFAEKNKKFNIDVVIGPALGGIVLSQWTAYHLSKIKNKKIIGVYSEKGKNKKQILKRGYNFLVKDKNILVIEDVTTTGGSVKEVISAVKKAGGRVRAVCVMVNRDPQNVTSKTISVPFSALADFPANSYPAKKCPMCINNIPIDIKLGHGLNKTQK